MFLSADDIRKLAPERKVHMLNSKAVRLNRSLGDAVGLKNLGALRRGSFHSLPDRFAHSWDRQQMHRFGYRIPIFFRNKNSVSSFSFNHNWLVRLCSLINQAVKFRSCLCDIKNGHFMPSF